MKKEVRTMQLLGLATFISLILAALLRFTPLVFARLFFALSIPIYSFNKFRCPHCDAWLGRDFGNYCRKCGHKLK